MVRLPASALTDIVTTEDNPAPPGLVVRNVVSAKGVTLRAVLVRDGGSKGTIVIACGRGDLIERYFETMRDFIARGYCVATFDFRDQGGSSRRNKDFYRDRLRRFSEYDEDLAAVMNQVVLPDCPPPYFALGHSTGGHVVLRALRNRIWFERAVLSAPLLGVDRGKWPKFLVKTLPRFVTTIGLGRLFIPFQAHRPLQAKDFPGNRLSADRTRFLRHTAILEREPRLGLGGVTFGWLAAALASLRELDAACRAGTWRVPILIVAAGRDRVVDTEAARLFAHNSGRIAFVAIDEARHELLCEVDAVREQFLAAFYSFIEADKSSPP